MDKLDPKILEIALQSLEAGETLDEIAQTRGVSSATYKYGQHLGNWTDGGSAGLEREMEATLPTSLVFMDNVKGEPLNLQLSRLKARGVKPLLIYRPYFNPTGGTSGAVIEGYANGAAIRMRDEYLPHPLIAEAYHEGRLIVKLFNETNIGGEGFARGRAGFADAFRCWKQARAIVKAQFPNAKFMSIANTPGNDDMWFTGDAQNQPYWYHGPQAAKANPTPSEIAAAIASCPFREMFELCDYIGIHVYSQDERQTRGDLQTWYSRRHEQALKFLTPYTNAGKKMIISEADCGYDQQPNPQEARAELFVWWLANVVGTNPAILTINHWWNVDDGEGAITWEKHQTRKGGEFRPVVYAIKAFREGALPPDVPPPPPPDPEIPLPPPTTGLPPRVTIDLPDFVTITEAGALPGERFWRAVRVERRRGDANGGQHHIFHWEPHNAAVIMVVGVEATTVVERIPHAKAANVPAADHPMSGGGNRYWSKVEGLGIVKSDQINGMTMPQNQHESYHITWELVTQPIGGGGVNIIDLWSNHHSSRAGQRVKYVILHSTASPANSTLESTAQYLKQNERGVSIHELVGDNTVYRMVADANAAHHAESETARLPGGEPNYLNNELTWGIEGFQLLTNPVSANVARLMLERVVAACRRLGIPSARVLAHREIDPTRRTDPLGIDMVQFRAAVASALGETVPVPPPPPPPPELRYDKIVWSMEQAARILQAEGWTREHDAVLSDLSYVEAVRERDN